MSGRGWGRHSKSCCKTPLGSIVVSTTWQISRGPATSSTTGVYNMLWHISRAEEEVMRECDIHHTRSIKTIITALITWAASLGWASAVTFCNIYREYHAPVVFTLSYIDFPRPITQIVFRMKCNQIQFSYYMDGIFCSILFHSVLIHRSM